MEKFLQGELLPISIFFHPYFIWNFWSKVSHLFYRLKFGANLNPFEINLIRFENRIGRTVPSTPPVSATPTALPHCLVPHPTDDDRAPRCAPTHLSATTSRCSMPRPGPPPLSLPLRLHAASTPPGPLPAAPLKWSHRPPANLFLPPRAVRLAHPRPSAAHPSP
jgi:hypothetical protein